MTIYLKNQYWKWISSVGWCMSLTKDHSSLAWKVLCKFLYVSFHNFVWLVQKSEVYEYKFFCKLKNFTENFKIYEYLRPLFQYWCIFLTFHFIIQEILNILKFKKSGLQSIYFYFHFPIYSRSSEIFASFL